MFKFSPSPALLFFTKTPGSVSLVFALTACGGDTLSAIPAPVEVPIEEVQNTEPPVSVAGLRAGFTDGGDIAPLDRVHLDGMAMGSLGTTHDPSDPANTGLIVSYRWEVVAAPEGVNPADFDFEGQGTGYLSLWLPLAGDYTVRLAVTNAAGIQSEDTPASRVSFSAIPAERFLIELTWDDNFSDQDLHLTNLSVSDGLCDTTDVYFGNMTPVWYSDYAAASGPNPILDVDDIDGLGPENINIDAPAVSTYRIYTHYFSGADTATSTIKIWVDGEVAATYSRQLLPNEVWAVAEIDWSAAGTPILTPYPSDRPGAVGSVADMASNCFFPWEFPY